MEILQVGPLVSVVWVLPFLLWGVSHSFHEGLGILLDAALSVDSQIATVVCTAYFHLRQIGQLCPYLDIGSLTMPAHALVVSRLDYCNALYMGLPLVLSQRLQQVQNPTARQLNGMKRHKHIPPTLATLHWLPVHFHTCFKIVVLTYKALNGLGPRYLAERLLLTRSACPVRSSQAGRLRVLIPREV